MSISSFWWFGVHFFHILVNFHHSDYLTDHQKLNIITNDHFIFDDLGHLFWHFSQLSSLGSLCQSSEVEQNAKISILFFNNLGGLFLHFGWLSLLKSLSWSLEVECNPKMSISFFEDFFSIWGWVGNGGYISQLKSNFR